MYHADATGENDPVDICNLATPTGIPGTSYAEFKYVDISNGFISLLAGLNNGSDAIVSADKNGENRQLPVIENVTRTPDAPRDDHRDRDSR